MVEMLWFDALGVELEAMVVAADTILRLILEMEVFSFPPLHQTSVPAAAFFVPTRVIPMAASVTWP